MTGGGVTPTVPCVSLVFRVCVGDESRGRIYYIFILCDICVSYDFRMDFRRFAIYSAAGDVPTPTHSRV